MFLAVYKYGGISLATDEEIRRVARWIAEDRQKGQSLVVVVSAPAGVTSALFRRAQALTSKLDHRWLDGLLATGEQVSSFLLALALEDLGVRTVVKTAHKTGIYTNDVHTDAHICHVDVGSYKDALNDGKVVVVSGFQGVGPGGDITTLGRGGSDLTALALAHFLTADRCRLFKKTGGVLRVDPNLISNDCRIERLSHLELEVFAQLGAKVIQPKAVRFARIHRVPIEVADSETHPCGTSVDEIGRAHV
jgi:aspartate kinase